MEITIFSECVVSCMEPWEITKYMSCIGSRALTPDHDAYSVEAIGLGRGGGAALKPDRYGQNSDTV